MNEFKGTKGKWMNRDLSIFTSDKENKIAVCEIVNDNYDTESLGNAQLIASAPELLEALQGLVFLHMCEQEGLSSGQPEPKQWLEAVDKASEAINKALGNKED